MPPFVRSLLLIALGAAPAIVGCSALDAPTAESQQRAPGDRALHTDDPTCKADSDCDKGEQCVEGVCQMRRCGTQAYASVAPLGQRSYFAVDRELMVVSDATSKRGVDGYEPTDGSFSHPSKLTYSFGSSRVIDVAGGNLTGSRPEAIAAAIDGSTQLQIVAGANRFGIDAGFVPVALAAGDVDGDTIDEVVAVSREGDVAVCSATTKRCDRLAIDGVTAKDVVVIDVDKDGRAEPVVLADRTSGKSSLFVLNVGAASSAEPAQVELPTSATLVRLAGGVLDTKSTPSLVALEEGGYADFAADTLWFFGLRDGKLAGLGSQDVAKDVVDVYLGDTDSDDRPELMLLEKSGIEVYPVQNETTLGTPFKTSLTASSSPTRLAMADLDGDSPAGMLVGKPETVPGPVVPIAVLVYPPYSRTYSDGTSRIDVGASQTQSDTEATTVSLRASLAVGFSAEFPMLVKASVWARVDGQISRTHADTRSMTFGDRFSVDARPDMEGVDNGVAVLACACYHAYTYRVEDPAGRLGDRAVDGKLMSLFVPVDGQTSMWSLKRYNALAKRVDTLPRVSVPYSVGNPDSYPASMQKLDGSPIPTEDNIFAAPHSYRTSDVARVSWSLTVSESKAVTDSRTIGVNLGGSLRVGPVNVDVEVGESFGSAYTVSVGKDTLIGGSVPAVRNNPQTPEDESVLKGYSFSPVVYREHYGSKPEDKGGYFVVTYSVAP